jgi:hypothetical protein
MCRVVVKFLITFAVAVVILAHHVRMMNPTSCSRFSVRIAFFSGLNLVTTVSAFSR